MGLADKAAHCEAIFEEGLQRAKRIYPDLKLPAHRTGDIQAWVWVYESRVEKEALVLGVTMMLSLYWDGLMGRTP